MLPAIGAASVALDAIQSLTSPRRASSQPVGFGSALSGASESSASSAASTTIAGFSRAQLSAGNVSTLLDAQRLASTNFVQARHSGGLTSDSSSSASDSSATQSSSASGTASSTYSSIHQLLQSTATPLGFNPFSVSV